MKIQEKKYIFLGGGSGRVGGSGLGVSWWM